MNILIQTEKSKLLSFDFGNEDLLSHCYSEIQSKLLIRPEIFIFNKICYQKRNVGFFSDTSIGYKYSNKLMSSQKLTPCLTILLNGLNQFLGSKYNGILINEYLNGEDYISSHSDDEANLDKSGVVTISFGESRNFRIRNVSDKKIVGDFEMLSGICFMMLGDFQKEFKHEIPIEKNKGCRVSFTFRNHLV
jgi:alkylated DNA repair dioxygenase AlkB